MSMQLLLNQHMPTPPTPPPTATPPLRQTTNDRGVCEQTTVPGCAQTTLAALAKRQFGGLERHLCHSYFRTRHSRTKGRDKGQEQSSASNKVRFYSYMIKSYKVSIIKLSVIHDRMGIFISTLIPTVIYSR